MTISPVAAGITNVIIEANDNKGGKANLTVNVIVKESTNTPPVISPTLFSSAQPEGRDIVTNVNITDNSGVREANLYYRRGGERDFRKVGLNQIGPSSFSATIPGVEVMSFGLEYYFEAIDIEGLKAHMPLSGVYAIQVDVAAPGLVKSDPQPGGTEQNAYRLISVPLDLIDKNPESVLGDEFGQYDKKKWRFYELNVNQTPIEFPNTSEMKLGKAFWLIVKESGKRISSGAGKSNKTDTVFTIPLHQKWNFLANPYNFPIPINNIRALMGNIVKAGTSLFLRALEQSHK